MSQLSESSSDPRPLILVGGGGHCRSCIDVVEACSRWRIIGILDRAERMGTDVLGYPVIGTDDDIARLAAAGRWFLVTIGQIKAAEPRRLLYDRIRAAGGRLATVVSPLAYVATRAKLGDGTIVMHRAVINSCVRIGDNAIINTMALVEHDATVGSHCHVSTAAIINGGATIGNGAFVGSNAVVIQGAVVPENVFVRAGAIRSDREI